MILKPNFCSSYELINYIGNIFRFLWDIFEQDRIKNIISGLDKKSGPDAILAISYDESDGRNKKTATLKKDGEKSKKIRELIGNFVDIKGSSNNWAGKY